MLFLQIPAPPSGAIESWLVTAAAVASAFLIFKKLLPHKSPAPADFITRSEFQHEVSTLRDKIDARFLTLSEKIEALGATINQRLTQIEAGLARVDERTRK